jgi:hypothetical protein
LKKGDVIVTTMDAAAARRQHSSVALAIFMAMAGMGLVGCESSNSLFSGSLFGSNNATAPEAVPAKQAATQPAIAKIIVAPIIGAPDAIAKEIQTEFTSTVEKQRIAVATGKEERADYTLRGYIVAAKDKNATKVSYIWDVTDPSGKRVNRITGEESVSGSASKDPWAALTPEVARAIANKAAGSFVAWLPSQTGQAAIASGESSQAAAGASVQAPAAKPHPVRPATAAGLAPTSTGTTTASITREGPIAAVVPSVTGAPGDGSKALADALQRELSSKGISIAEKPTALAYRVEGSVTLGQAKEGKQPINIEWLVRDPHGKKVGTVSQKNEIPEGSLDGTWGKTAEQAAGAAAQGIIKLLPQSKAVN